MKQSRIQQSFNRGAETYNSVSDIQRSMARILYGISKPFLENSSRIVDAGAGTGHLTRLLSELKPKNITAVDISPQMLEFNRHFFRAEKNIDFVCEDINTYKIPKNTSAVLSSATVQWIQNLPELIHNWNHRLADDGLVILSTFSPGTLCELHQAYREALQRPLSTPVFYRSCAQLEAEFHSSHYSVVHCEKHSLTQFFNSGLELLKHFQQTGTSVPQDENPMYLTRSGYQRLISQLEGNRQKDGIPLSWEAVFIVGKKKK